MCKVRSETSRSRLAWDGVGVHARLPLEDHSSCRYGCVLLGRVLLILNPGIELLWRIDVYTQQHHRVLRTAELSALPEIEPRLLGIHPHCVHMICDQICLSSQLRDPEAVVDVCRSQLEEGRCGRSVGTNWNVEFVCGDYAVFGVSKFPPELGSNHCDME